MPLHGVYSSLKNKILVECAPRSGAKNTTSRSSDSSAEPEIQKTIENFDNRILV